MIKNFTTLASLLICALSITFSGINYSHANEHSIKGILDVRTSHVGSDSHADSYLSGDYGKYSFDNGNSIALGQLGLQYHGAWDNNLSATVVANAFIDSSTNGIGLTEAFLRYKALPNANGWRYQSKVGIFYPKISLENIATAWSTPHTLTSSTLNNWVGEEFRHSGAEFTVEKLGKFSNSIHDFSFDIALFQNNDTAGAMLSWHGWTIGNRQTLLHEKLTVQPFKAREKILAKQAASSDPFIELDNRWGTHLTANWKIKNKVKLNLGYYDNNADPSIVKKGQYTWATTFNHAGIKVNIAPQLELISQIMKGSTFMQSPSGARAVDNDFQSAFMMIRKYSANHNIAVRVEEFSVDDYDQTWGDNNNEYGKAVTLSYRYNLTRKRFFHTEINWLQSDRASRYYLMQPISLIERQAQLSYRLYF